MAPLFTRLPASVNVAPDSVRVPLLIERPAGRHGVGAGELPRRAAIDRHDSETGEARPEAASVPVPPPDASSERSLALVLAGDLAVKDRARVHHQPTALGAIEKAPHEAAASVIVPAFVTVPPAIMTIPKSAAVIDAEAALVTEPPSSPGRCPRRQPPVPAAMTAGIDHRSGAAGLVPTPPMYAGPRPVIDAEAALVTEPPAAIENPIVAVGRPPPRCCRN